MSALRNTLLSLLLLAVTISAQAMFIWVDDNPTELQMSNEIAPGDIDTINRMVQSGELNQVRTVVIWDSAGGHVDTALDIGRWIHANGLTTNVIGKCVSACVHIAIAGANKIISEDGSLHVHWMYIANESGLTPYQVAHNLQETQARMWQYADDVGARADAYMYLTLMAGPDLKRLSKAEAENIGFTFQ
jgi:hypothetical protein